jgi:hypothetical protein
MIMKLCKVALLLSLVILMGLRYARADYKFITANPYEAQKRLFEDIRTGEVDTASLGPYAIAAITQESLFSATPAKLNHLGPISRICLFVGFKYPASRALSLRTFHSNGCGDWVLTTELSPEILKSIVLVTVKFEPGRTDFCGPPGIIPPVPAGGESFALPLSLQCRSVDNLATPKESDELAKACKIISGMCNDH